MDAQSYRTFFGQLPTGVTAIIASSETGPVGLVVGTFSSVSLDPPLVSFMVNGKSRSWAAVRAQRHFTASILASDQAQLSQALSSWSPDKFRDVVLEGGNTNVVRGCLAWANCVLNREIEAGDHAIVLAVPSELTIARAAKPLIFFQRAYHRTFPVEDFRPPGWV